jgi:hypothetical protein
MEALNKTVNAIISEAVNPAIYLLSALAFVWFLYGVFLFVLAKFNNQQDGIQRGKNHMLWGLVGLVIIYSAAAIYKFITGFFV